MVEVKERC